MTAQTPKAKAPEATEEKVESKADKAPLFLTCMIPAGHLEEEQVDVEVPIAGQMVNIPRGEWVTRPAPFVIAAQQMTEGESIKRQKFSLSDFKDEKDVPVGTTQHEYEVKDIPRFPSMQIREPNEEEYAEALKKWPRGLVLGKE